VREKIRNRKTYRETSIQWRNIT